MKKNVSKLSRSHGEVRRPPDSKCAQRETEVRKETTRMSFGRRKLSLKCRSFSTYPSIAQEKNCRSEVKVGRQTCLIFLQNGWTHGGERWLVQALSRAKRRRGQASTRAAIGQDDHHFVEKRRPRQISSTHHKKWWGLIELNVMKSKQEVITPMG